MYPHIKMHNGFEEFAKKKEKKYFGNGGQQSGNNWV
jgi:hypothetical protein